MSAVNIEITAGDFGEIVKLFDALVAISEQVDGRMSTVEIRAVLDGQLYRIGYGESAEPAILSVGDLEAV